MLGSARGELFAQGAILLQQCCEVYLRLRLRHGDALGAGGVQEQWVKLSFNVVFTVAIGHEVHKYIEVLEAQTGNLGRYLLAGVSGAVAGLAYVFEPMPDVVADDAPEVLRVHEAG